MDKYLLIKRGSDGPSGLLVSVYHKIPKPWQVHYWALEVMSLMHVIMYTLVGHCTSLPIDVHLLCICNLNNFYICSVVRQVDGTLVKRYKHPGPVYGCDWSLNNRYAEPYCSSLCSVFNCRYKPLPFSKSCYKSRISGWIYRWGKTVILITITSQYNEHSDWLKQRALSEYRCTE